MSDSQYEDEMDARGEIQKLLTQINGDMSKLKNELTSINTLIGENGSLPETAKHVNTKLLLLAKEAGIDLEKIGNITDLQILETQKSKSS